MYCLDCGKKINDDELQCPHCGSSVIAMKERIAKAHEQIVYADAVPALDTTRLPLVSERSYVDREGNPLDPKSEVELNEVSHHADDLTAIPELGYSDPYLTAPMQRIVSSDGRIVADVDRDAKVYLQEPPRRKFPVKALIVILVIAILGVAAYQFGPQAVSEVQSLIDSQVQSSSQAPSPSTAAQQQANTQPSTQKEYTAEDFQSDLESAYQDLSSYRDDVDTVVEGLEGYFKVTKKTTRQKYADECNDLLKTLTDERSELKTSAKSVNASSDKNLNKKYQNIDELYGYLIERLDVVSQCWKVSLTYDEPQSHSSEILSPLTTDLKNGNSVSETSFDELYPNADPSK